jgi:hypothetical protein
LKKHLLKIEFIVVGVDGGPPSEVQLIETVNKEIVLAGRGIVNSAVKSDIAATLQSLRTQVGPCVSSCFNHTVKVSGSNGPDTYNWLVCTGLFRGLEDNLLNSASELWERGEKVIPWAGCAGLIPTAGKPFANEPSGNVFCFLPLPDALGGCRLPVQINGFFDVDTSRKSLTHEASATGTVERLRGQWNRKLLEEGVAPAYGQMLLRFIELNPALGPEDFYPLWLNPDQNFPPPLDSLPKALYANLASLKLLRSSNLAWVTPAELRLAEPDLKPPLVAEKWSKIAEIEVPPHILNGFAKAGRAIQTLTSAELRSFLKTSNDTNCLPEKESRQALQKREWLVSLAGFAFKGATEADLAGLPLLLLSDGTLHTIGHLNRPVYLAGQAERDIFSKFQGWFVDPDYATATALPEASASKIFRMKPDHVLNHLPDILPKDAGKDFLTWLPEAADVPNEKWLAGVFEFFLNQPPIWKPDPKLLLQPCLIPDQNNRLWPVGSASTPLRMPASLDPRLRVSLQSLSIQLVTGGLSLLKTIEAFAARFGQVRDRLKERSHPRTHRDQVLVAGLPSLAGIACQKITRSPARPGKMTPSRKLDS